MCFLRQEGSIANNAVIHCKLFFIAYKLYIVVLCYCDE